MSEVSKHQGVQGGQKEPSSPGNLEGKKNPESELSLESLDVVVRKILGPASVTYKL